MSAAQGAVGGGVRGREGGEGEAAVTFSTILHSNINIIPHSQRCESSTTGFEAKGDGESICAGEAEGTTGGGGGKFVVAT